MCFTRDLGASSSLSNLLQQTSDNAEGVKEIEQRVQSLSGVLAHPISEDDYAERARRTELRRFVLMWVFINLLIPLPGSSMGS